MLKNYKVNYKIVKIKFKLIGYKGSKYKKKNISLLSSIVQKVAFLSELN